MKIFYTNAVICLVCFLFFQCSSSPKQEKKTRPQNPNTQTPPTITSQTNLLNLTPKGAKTSHPNAEKFKKKSVEQALTQIIEPSEKEALVLKDLPYVNPYQEKWDSVFGKDLKWMEAYNNSVLHFLQGCQNNLDANPRLKMKKVMIVHVYGEKMTDTFFLTPAFGAFCKSKFAQSTAFQAFIDKNSGRITD